MRRISAVWLLACLLLSPDVWAWSKIYKCVSDGSVTYQAYPCPTGETSKRSTVHELNAQRQQGKTPAPAPAPAPAHAQASVATEAAAAESPSVAKRAKAKGYVAATPPSGAGALSQAR